MRDQKPYEKAKRKHWHKRPFLTVPFLFGLAPASPNKKGYRERSNFEAVAQGEQGGTTAHPGQLLN
jgi:hypothetical protein